MSSKHLNVNGILICRIASLFVMVLNAHSQVLFPALDPSTNTPWLVYASIACIIVFPIVAAVFIVIYKNELNRQLGPYGTRGKYFYIFILLSFIPDVLGIIFTVFLGQIIEFDTFSYISNLLPPILSMCNTMINAYI
jgi:hypothetical protein